jgi:hypothetical protein
MSAYDEGVAAHAAGTPLTENPHSQGSTDSTDWAAGWSDAQAAAVSGGASSTPTEQPPAEQPPAEAEPDPVAAVESLGEAGYDRIMELLTNPPIDDLPDGGASLPPNGEVPSDLGEWLEAWKQPLAFVTVDAAIGAVKTRISGQQRGRLKELYRGMAPDAMAAAMQANADTIAKFADERVAEAGLISSMQTMVTQKAAGYLLSALMLV